jgi:formylglycine-generating enzyme required for sulfatase activity
MAIRSIFILAAVLSAPLQAYGKTQSVPLVMLSQPGPWAGVSGIIGFRGRVWFVNSVKFRNHNSADIYSYDPVSGETRYERHLFSQDAGDPVVAEGILYWPFEDARFSAGRGEYALTDGERWQWHLLPQGEVFHLHGMAAHKDTLYAATSAWRGGLQRSTDRGKTWTIVYDHPTPEKRVSRFTSLAVLDGALYAGLTSYTQAGPKLFRFNGTTLSPVHDWPPGDRTDALQVHAGWLYGVNDQDQERQIWRTNGVVAEQVTGLEGIAVRTFASAPDALWAVSASKGRGALWRSVDGKKWSRVQQFDDAEPLDVGVYAGQVYVGTSGPVDRGALWGPPAPAASDSEVTGPLPTRLGAGVPDSSENLRRMAAGLARMENRKDYRALLHAHVQPLALSRSPAAGAAMSRSLDADVPDLTLSAFGGALQSSLRRINRWYLLWGIALNGSGSVPLDYLAEVWRDSPNRAEKYFNLAPAAAWTTAQLGQNDDEVIDLLIARLGARDEPEWLAGDWVGALTALTGERFGYDRNAWRQWWTVHRGMIRVPAGNLVMGTASGEPAEGPPHEVTISRFYMDRFEVTNAEFSEFVEATGHQTSAERSGKGWHWTGTWRQVNGADWRHPRGPGSSIRDLDRHPVVQVSWRDADAYCRWRKKRLPTEAEWERAARGAGGREYAWGDAPPGEGGRYRASYGSDPCCKPDDGDGFLHTAPVGGFPDGRSPFAIEDMTGNVWEWVIDTFAEDYYRHSPSRDPVNTAPGPKKVIRGGGWGNNPWGLRTTLRHANPPDTSLSMVGIRCASTAKHP